MALFDNIVKSLPGISPQLRTEIDAETGSIENHRRRVAQISQLNSIDLGSPARSLSLTAPVGIVSWNIERGYHIDEIVGAIESVGPAVVLLSEVDLGMARTGQRHVARELADRLGMNYAFGLEFVELGLGSARERALFEGESNELGFHGAAILSAAELQHPGLLRLETSGDWYGSNSDERRIGGRMALAATIDIAGKPVTFATTHFENRSTPQQRANQMTILLDGLDAHAPGNRVVIGGDFNTNTADRDRPDWETYQVEQQRINPNRFTRPEAYEPMFAVALEHGFSWADCNAVGATTRLQPWQSRDKPLSKLDWFFAKGLDAKDAAIVPAVAKDSGLIISDHDMLSVSIELAPR